MWPGDLTLSDLGPSPGTARINNETYVSTKYAEYQVRY